jgi:hypothetical protein
VNKKKWWIIIVVTVILILPVLDYSHEAPPPFISRATPIQPLLNQRIIIRGSGFGNSMPKVYRLGDSADTVAIGGSGSSLATRDHGSGANSWTAERIFGLDVNMTGLKLEGWSDSQAVLNGFGSALGSLWKMDLGDPTEIVVYGPNNSGMATFKATVISHAPEAARWIAHPSLLLGLALVFLATILIICGICLPGAVLIIVFKLMGYVWGCFAVGLIFLVGFLVFPWPLVVTVLVWTAISYAIVNAIVYGESYTTISTGTITWKKEDFPTTSRRNEPPDAGCSGSNCQ